MSYSSSNGRAEDEESDESVLARLRRPVSPPPLKRRRLEQPSSQEQQDCLPSTAAVEAGRLSIDDHLDYFSRRLSAARRASPSGPTLSIANFKELYLRNQHDNGAHFVIHQHDHPIAGTHYDLRLQINELSSVSWAIMYGLPGHPNSQKLNRNATETRVHCLWNHLIETASSRTGSLLIWDTGEYEILPYDKPEEETDDEFEASVDVPIGVADSGFSESQPSKLNDDFRKGKIRLRLHGARLPENYTITLRMQRGSWKSELGGSARTGRRRPRRIPKPVKEQTDSEDEMRDGEERTAVGSDHSDNDENQEIRRNNAYTGSLNSIGSIHQRTWYVSLDRESSGFQRKRDKDGLSWERRNEQGKLLGFEPFFVRGRDAEKSVITGRLGKEVLADEGVVGYVGRAGWRPVLA